MDDSWRFRPLQPTTTSCPVCSVPHFPFCPPPPPPPHPHLSFEHRIGYSAGPITHGFPPDLSHPPFHHPPFPEHRTASSFLVRESLPPQLFPDQDFLEREGLRKRMRVDDPNPLGLGLGFSSEDERRMKLIRNHGRQQNIPPPPLPPPMQAYDGFLGSNGRIQEPLPSHQNHHFQANSSYEEVYPKFAETPRFLLQERTGFDRFGGAGRRYEQFDSPVAPTVNPPLPPYRRYQQFDTSRPRTENFTVRAPEERPFNDSQRQIYPADSSSYGSQKQPHYPATNSYSMMLNVDNVERKISYMAATDNHRPTESRIELQSWHNEVMENPYELKHLSHEEIRKKPFETKSYDHPLVQEDFPSDSYRLGTGMTGQDHFSEAFPPLPQQPPIPPPPEPSPPLYRATVSVPTPPPMPSHVPDVPNNMQGSSEPHPPAQISFYNEPAMHNSTGFAAEGLPLMDQLSSKEYMGRRYETFKLSHFHEEKSTVVDACHLFRQPHRASRPDHFVIILRGLPGSGKSYLAKKLRNLEVEAGGNAPRIHAMDDYFMIEVEKVEDSEGFKSSGSSRGKKQITKKVIEYCYEPELEEAYRSSMLKAFKKTLDEGNFTFVIVDDRNLRVADFAQFWAIAKRSGYEVYVLEATYKDPTGCAARNVHGFTVEDIQEMAKQWEEAPPLYMQLDIKSLFRGDDLSEQSIQEVDMDTDDAGCDDEETNNKLQHKEDLKMTDTKIFDHNLDAGSVKVGERWNTEEEDELTVPNEVGKSKWSKDEDIENSNDGAQHLTALSGLLQAYGKGEKSVHWGDHVGQSGFSIAALQKQCRSSLVIGPGSGYNLISNPLPVDEDVETFRSNDNESKRCFTEQLRAERESFKAVFDRRRQRIGGLWDAEDDQ